MEGVNMNKKDFGEKIVGIIFFIKGCVL